MIDTLVYGLTIGAILYLFSIGLSITFGTMKIINFGHAITYTLGVYFFITFLSIFNGIYIIAALLSIVCIIPVAFVIEKFIIRKLYGSSLDYAIIATYAVLLIGTDLIKSVWGAVPRPVSDPIGTHFNIIGVNISTYRIVITIIAILLFFALRLFYKRSIIGKIVIAALDDTEGVLCLGLNVNKYYSIMFIVGSVLAVLGGVLYAPISAADPYMGVNILFLAFAVVIVGGMGDLNGTFYSAFILGLIMAFTARFWSQASDTMVFVVMAGVLIYKRFKVSKI